MKPGDNRAAYEDFLGDASLAVVTDPPFGGKVELVDRCIRSVAQDWRRVNGGLGQGGDSIENILAGVSARKTD